MELFPAPFGPMIALTSCSRTSNDTSTSAFTPPNESDTFSTARTTSPTRCAPAIGCGTVIESRRLAGRRGREGPGVADLEVGRERAGAPVLVAYLRLDVHVFAAAVERLHQGGVLLGDEPPPHLARARELLVVGIEILVQDQETVDLGVGELGILGEVGVHPLDAPAHQLVHLVAQGEVGETRVRI